MTRRSRFLLLLAAAVAVAAIYGIAKREIAVMNLRRLAEKQALLPVEVIHPSTGPATRSLTLPGTVRAWFEAPIFAQVAGYVQSWAQDYGATVKSGQLLAVIDTPGLDAQYEAAKANREVAAANYKLATTTAARWQALAGTPAVSKQEVDVQVAGAAARKAELEAAEQNMARYAALEAFKRVVAPFDGVVIARLTDVGSYVNAGGGDAGARVNSTQLFTVADIHALRVFVSVPQDFASGLGQGVIATLHLPSRPGNPIAAKFLTTARAFDPNSRTAVTELTVDNPNRSLWPGTFVEVEFHMPSNPNILTIPEQALIFQSAGIQVALLGTHNKVHLQNVTLGDNLGKIVQVTSGLSRMDRVVNNPPAGLLEGQAVAPVAAIANNTAPAAGPEPPPPPGAVSGYGRTKTP